MVHLPEMNDERVTFGAGIGVALPREKLQPGTTLYMAGPGGFAEATRPFHEIVVDIVRRMGGTPLDPWQLTPIEKIQAVQTKPLSAEAVTAWEALNKEIAENNLKAIYKATGIIANLDGTDVDSGTAAEIGVGFMRGIPIIGYRGDFRLARDNWGGTVNLQVEYFIKQSGQGKGAIITAIAQLPQELLRVWG